MQPFRHQIGLLARGCGLPALVLLGACAGTPEPVTGVIATQSATGDGRENFATNSPGAYVLRPADVISVSVYREPDLSLAAVPIASDGTISVPLVGQVAAAGSVADDLARRIAAALEGGGYLRRAQVSVNVTQYNSHRVTVEGAVKNPGVYQFVPGERLSSAIALAAGPTQVAKLEQVAVFRPSAEGMTAAKFDFRAVQQGTMIDPVILPGDRVVVGTSGLSQAWRDALGAIPVFALFTNI